MCAYRNDQRGNNYQNNRSSKPVGKDILRDVYPIGEPLSTYYGKRKDTFLVDGPVYQTAEKIKKISNSQLRKVLSQSKAAMDTVSHGHDSFADAQQQLFLMVPMVAYNCSRASGATKGAYEDLVRFVYRNIGMASIQSEADIQMFDQITTTLVAYHKFIGGEK